MIIRKGQRLGSVRVDRQQQLMQQQAAGTEPQPEPEPERRPDGAHSVGGGWHEIVIDGEVIDKVRGVEAAQSAYEAYIESEPDESTETGSA